MNNSLCIQKKLLLFLHFVNFAKPVEKKTQSPGRHIETMYDLGEGGERQNEILSLWRSFLFTLWVCLLQVMTRSLYDKTVLLLAVSIVHVFISVQEIPFLVFIFNLTKRRVVLNIFQLKDNEENMLSIRYHLNLNNARIKLTE